MKEDLSHHVIFLWNLQLFGKKGEHNISCLIISLVAFLHCREYCGCSDILKHGE